MSITNFQNVAGRTIEKLIFLAITTLTLSATPSFANPDEPLQTRQSGDGRPEAQRRIRRRFEREQIAPPSRKKTESEERKRPNE